MSDEGLRVSRKRPYEQIETAKNHVEQGTLSNPQCKALGISNSPYNDEPLCVDCQKIDMKEILSRSKGKIRACCGVAVADLGQRIPGNAINCSLCRLFTAVRVSSKNFCGQYHLRAVSFLKSYPEIIHCAASKALKDADIICLVVLPGNSKRRHLYPSCSINSDIGRCERTGYICPTTLPNSPDLPSFAGRFVKSHSFDYQLVQGWVDFCQKRHFRSCIVGPNFHSVLFMVIDCESRSIVRAPPNCTYVALSYVWGSKQKANTGKSATETEISPNLPESVPKVVQDAILVTKKLGWQYLWVDRYCINEGDQKDKDDQINNMDKIYKGAIITIVAAAGIDDGFGLPGVGATPKIPQPFAVIGQFLLVSTLCHPSYSIKDSKWAARAWTYQEGVLSTRRLVFTKEQIYFECKSMHCCETIRKPLDILHRKKGRQGLLEYIRRGYFEEYCGLSGSVSYESNADPCDYDCNKFTQLRSHLEQFTGRRLSHESDSINAFMGILREYARQEPVIHHYWGLPINHPWEDSPATALTISLAWSHRRWLNKQPIHRRRGFPSFSWAGWDGIARLPDNDAYASFRSRLIFLADSETSQILGCRNDQFAQRDWSLVNLSPHLHIEVTMIQIQLVFVPEVANSNINPRQMPVTGFQLAHEGKAMTSVLFELSGWPLKGEETLDSLQNKYWDCVILGESSDWYCVSTYLMLIEWHGDVAERIGIAIGLSSQLTSLVLSARQTRRRIKLG